LICPKCGYDRFLAESEGNDTVALYCNRCDTFQGYFIRNKEVKNK